MGGLVFEAYGLRIGIRWNDPAASPYAEKIAAELGWPELKDPITDLIFSVKFGEESHRKGVKNYHLLYADTVRVRRTMDLGEIWNSLVEMLHSYVTANNRKYIFLAASLSIYKGSAILLPGNTEVQVLDALKASGAVTISEHFTALSEEGFAVAYPDRFLKQMPLALIAFTERSDRVRVVRSGLLTISEACWQLFPYATNTLANPAKALSHVARLASGTKSIRCRYSCEQGAARVLLKRL